MSGKNRVLFVLKYRDDPYGTGAWSGSGSSTGSADPHKPLSSGLANSAQFVSDMLVQHGIASKCVHVPDNNSIHKEIVAFGATHVIIEAYWVVPSKFLELHAVCPNVHFIVRNHSELPFLAGEGIGVEWTKEYLKLPYVSVACNSMRSFNDFRAVVGLNSASADGIEFLPNYYPIGTIPDCPHKQNYILKDHVDVGCFGAIRPLKNNLLQAIGAIWFAQLINRPLVYHINGYRLEMGGGPYLKNVRALFPAGGPNTLVEHPWLDHADFMSLISTMDVVQQVSFSETFNIVAADAAVQNVPIVVSSEVPWADKRIMADPTDSSDIASKMVKVYQKHIKTDGRATERSIAGLNRYNASTVAIWLAMFAG